VRGFSQELSDRYGFAVDFAIHAPREFPGSDPRNFHAHLLTTTREVTLLGLGAKTTLDMRDGNRLKLGLEPAINELLHVRARWATVTNEALKEAQIAARVDYEASKRKASIASGSSRGMGPPPPHLNGWRTSGEKPVRTGCNSGRASDLIPCPPLRRIELMMTTSRDEAPRPGDPA